MMIGSLVLTDCQSVTTNNHMTNTTTIRDLVENDHDGNEVLVYEGRQGDAAIRKILEDWRKNDDEARETIDLLGACEAFRQYKTEWVNYTLTLS